MSLIYAEGFEHFHGSARNLSMPGGGHLGPKYEAWRYAMQDIAGASQLALTGNPHHYWPRIQFGHEFLSVRQGMIGEHIEVGRKRGKSLSIEATSYKANSIATPHFNGCTSFTFKVKKSRTLFLGFALRLDIPIDPETGEVPAPPQIIVNFGR